MTDLGAMNEQVKDAEIARVREFCVELFMKLETGLRVQWIQGMAQHNSHITPSIFRGERGTI